MSCCIVALNRVWFWRTSTPCATRIAAAAGARVLLAEV